MCSSLSFDKYMDPCNCLANQGTECFYYLPNYFIPFPPIHPLLYPLLGNHWSGFYNYRLNLPVLELHIKELNMYSVWLLLLSIIFLRFMYVPFYCWVVFHDMNKPQLVYSFSWWNIIWIVSSLRLLGMKRLWVFMFKGCFFFSMLYMYFYWINI